MQKNQFFYLNYFWHPFCCPLDSTAWGRRTTREDSKTKAEMPGTTHQTTQQHIPEVCVCPPLISFEPMKEIHCSWYKYQLTAGHPAPILLNFMRSVISTWPTFNLEVTIVLVKVGFKSCFDHTSSKTCDFCHSKFLVQYQTANVVNMQTHICLWFVDNN